MPTFEEYRDEYTRRWESMTVRPEWVERAARSAQRIIDARQHYEPVSGATGVPWHIIGILHQMECGGSFRGHLHNGDPLTARTRQVPRGRPVKGSPPFTWEASACDALCYEGLDKIHDWEPARVAWCLELYNGFGYRRHGVPSAYLWSGSNQYVRGKYVSDGVWSSAAISEQAGGMIILKALQDYLPELKIQSDTLAADAAEFPKTDDNADETPEDHATRHEEAHAELKESSWAYWANRVNIKTITAASAGSMIWLKEHALEIGAAAIVAVILFEIVSYYQRETHQ